MHLSAIMLILISSFSAAQAAEYSASSRCHDAVYKQPPGVDYQGGVDARGWAVAGADLDPPAITKDDFDPVRIDLNLPLVGQRGEEVQNQLPGSVDLGRAEIRAGSIDIYQSGDVTFNDKRIGNTQASGEECP